MDVIPQAILDLASEFRAAGNQPTLHKLKLALRSVLENVQKEVFLVMDALDECPEWGDHVKRRDLLNELLQIYARRHCNLHILVTSRAEIDIQRSLEKAASISLRIEDLFQSDIRLLVQQRLGEGKLARWNQQLKTEIENRLLNVEEL